MRNAGILAIVLGVALACIAMVGNGTLGEKTSVTELQSQFDPDRPEQVPESLTAASAMSARTTYEFVGAGVALAAGALLLRQSRQ